MIKIDCQSSIIMGQPNNSFYVKLNPDLDEHLDVKYSAGTKAWCSYMIIVTSVFFSFSIA